MGKIAHIGNTFTWKPFAVAGTLLVASAVAAVGMSTQARAETPSTPSASAPAAPPPHHRQAFGEESGGSRGLGMFPLGGPGLDRLLKEVNASDAQSAKIKALAQAAEADLKPIHETGRGLHEKTLALFAQAKVDAAAAEELRRQGVAQHDAASKRMLQLALDVSKVLTPEQRAGFVAKMQKRHERMDDGRPGRARAEH